MRNPRNDDLRSPSSGRSSCRYVGEPQEPIGGGLAPRRNVRTLTLAAIPAIHRIPLVWVRVPLRVSASVPNSTYPYRSAWRNRMDLGVYLAYAPWIALDEQLQVAREADELGFHSAWVAETWGRTRRPCCRPWLSQRRTSGLARRSCRSLRDSRPRLHQPSRRSTSCPTAGRCWGWGCPDRRSLRVGTGCRSSHRWAGPGVHRYRPHGTRTGEGRVSRQALPPAG